MYLRFFTVLVLLGAGVLQVGAQTPAPSNDYVFPLFVDGTANGSTYRSVVRVSNTGSTSPNACVLNQRNTNASFTGIQGGPNYYVANLIDAGFSPLSVTQVRLDPFVPFEVLRTSGQSALTTGYVKLSCPGTVAAQVQFALYDSKNNKLGEAAVLPATQGNSFQFLVDERDGTRLGFSLANDSAVGGQYQVIARDEFNNIISQAVDFIEPTSQVSRFIDEVQGLALPANFVGSIEIVGVSGSNSYVTGLQFTGPVFSTIAPIVRSKPIGS
jgi:hypothetical protein